MASGVRIAHAQLTRRQTCQVAEDLIRDYDAGCGKPAAYGVSLGGERYRPTCWEHAIFHASPQARTVTTVELAPLDWAFGDDAPSGSSQVAPLHADVRRCGFLLACRAEPI